ncbi:rhamnogalacturonan acetylesterase [Terriglobus saanensis]|uniref:Lipolytic protein G-D-S-L family n=1 Tax=Terriglobus saanensis (strain ATCC BAA-1853 / DSM 23119 / SP1PR4) TaxID=401053 RepID=E8V0C3_TERSS|nr:rhamnogalacturonan acetylesterase [Terriglobus saanensis]ADV83341.1 lipolytic protein G-D-S-L family [Terriglobus saanensis SP1PR4]
MMVLFFAGTVSVAAQNAAVATQPEDNVARPTPTYTAVDMPANPKLPTLWIVGDSTARNGKDLGWGDHFAPLVDTARINVVNRARAGRSSRTFIHEGAWDMVVRDLRPGDFVLIQMGHNDGGDLDGAKPRGSIKGIGDEQKEVVLLTGEHEVVHTFGWYLRKYIADTRSKGATPILLDLTVRNIWKDGKIERDMGYNGFIRQVAESEHAPFVDLSNVEADKLETLGQTKTALLFPIDHTHTSSEGATVVATAVGEALRRSDAPVKAFLLAKP